MIFRNNQEQKLSETFSQSKKSDSKHLSIQNNQLPSQQAKYQYYRKRFNKKDDEQDTTIKNNKNQTFSPEESFPNKSWELDITPQTIPREENQTVTSGDFRKRLFKQRAEFEIDRDRYPLTINSKLDH